MSTLNNTSDYSKYRGKCKEFVDSLIEKDSSLIAVRGYYHDVYWGKQQHWWCTDKNGKIIDPTKNQFPSKGNGKYEEFDGYIECAECTKRLKEEYAIFHSNYAFCSTACNLRFVGL